MLLIFIFIFALTIFAGMAKLVDVPDLGSGAARRVGSSPITRTFKNPLNVVNKRLKGFLFDDSSMFPPNLF